jgi:nitronate monooxygenase
MTTLQDLFGVQLPVIQAPMAGVQDSRLALAVSNAGGLGSLRCVMLAVDAIRKELAAIRAGTDKPFNVNFFCHALPTVSLNARRSGVLRLHRTTRNSGSP